VPAQLSTLVSPNRRGGQCVGELAGHALGAERSRTVDADRGRARFAAAQDGGQMRDTSQRV
jgi:hypothetical protein